MELKHPPGDVLTLKKHTWLRNRYVWISLVFVLVASIITALAVTLSEAESNPVPPILEFENEDVVVNEGHRSIQWVVNVTGSSQPKLVWYGPNCTVLEEHDGPTRHEVYTSPNRTVTKLKLYNVSVADRGLYRLQASNEEGENWAYFTLNVKGKNPLYRQHVIVCYVFPWARRSQRLVRFTVDNIDPTLCTHLVYASAVLNMTSNAIESADPEYDLEENNGQGAYRKMTSLKRDYPHLKVLLNMVGCEKETEHRYMELVESPARRKDLVRNVSEFLRKYNFDGLDLVWHYPLEEKHFPVDKQNFVSLLKDFREEFDKFSLLLTSPLGVTPTLIEAPYDILAVSQYLHYIFVLSFDYHMKSTIGPNAPLYPRNDGDNLNVETCINTLLRKGADRSKLVLGLPLLGRMYEVNNTEVSVGFPKEFEGKGKPVPYIRYFGFLGYNEICLMVDNPTNNWKKYWGHVTHTPYASKDNYFITYDNARSLTDKVELAVRKKLAGVVVYSLEKDDFSGSCTFGRSGSTGYPLMRAINNALDNSVSWKKFPCLSRSFATGPVD